MNSTLRKNTLRAAGVLVALPLALGFSGVASAEKKQPVFGPQTGVGVYAPTQVGVPSGNGNGNGKALGKPGAGTVGRADSKEPFGQLPGPGKDGNNGYECDGNNGIGLSNPAHTGCATDVN